MKKKNVESITDVLVSNVRKFLQILDGQDSEMALRTIAAVQLTLLRMYAENCDTETAVGLAQDIQRFAVEGLHEMTLGQMAVAGNA